MHAGFVLQGEPHKCALFFVDNSGIDIILGVFPFVRELLIRGTQVRLQNALHKCFLCEGSLLPSLLMFHFMAGKLKISLFHLFYTSMPYKDKRENDHIHSKHTSVCSLFLLFNFMFLMCDLC